MQALLAVNSTKFVDLDLEQVMLTTFNVTKDNTGGSIIADQSGILYRLSGVVAAVVAVINTVLDNYQLQLPSF